MPNSLKVIPWRMTRRTYNLYLAFGAAAMEAPDEEHRQQAIEGLKMLPGYPMVEGDEYMFDPVIIKDVSNLRPN